MSYHTIIIVGNLGKDPVMRYTQDGTPVTNFSIAVNRRWNGDNPGEETTWFRIAVWSRQAEVCNEYLKKGRQVLVEGRLQPDATGNPRIWTGDDGIARTSFEVRAQIVRFLDGRGDDGDGASQNQSQPQAPPASAPVEPEDEIPF
jgi:single-strand DNA-binding protein